MYEAKPSAMPNSGSQPSFTAKRFCSSNPTTNVGKPIAHVVRIVTTTSVAEPPQRSENPGADADHDVERDRDHGQLRAVHQLRGENLGDGAALGEVLAQVTLQQPHDVVAVLHDERVVQPVPLPQLGDNGRIAHSVPAERADRIAR